MTVKIKKKNESKKCLVFLYKQVHGSIDGKSPPHNTYESDNEDSSSSSIITGGAQTPPSANRLGHNTDAHSLKSQTPLSIKSEHSSNAAHTRSPSSGALAPSNNNSSNHNNNLTTSLACMPSTSPYGVNSNLAPPPLPASHHFNHPNALLYHQHPGHHHHHVSSNEWYNGMAVAAAAPPADINHLNPFHHQHHLMHHATAYWN